MTDTICIYALLEPETDEVRYIGQTVDPHYRLVSHAIDAWEREK